jgi:hypothetical protein
MDGQRPVALVPSVFACTLVLLLLDAGSGPGWGTSSAHVVLAARGEHLATSPLYDLLASAFALLPAGEPGFRLGVLAALLGAWTLAGVVAASRALLPGHPATGLVGAALLLVAPPFREAAAFAAPGMLAAAGLMWTIACALRFARAPAATPAADHRDDGPLNGPALATAVAAGEPMAADANVASPAQAAPDAATPSRRDMRDGVLALLASAVVVGSAPWLGVLAMAVVAIGLVRAGMRRDLLAITAGGIGGAVVLWWLGAAGALPGLTSSIGLPLLAAGRASAAVLVGAGLVGIGFAVLTKLPHARLLAVFIAIAVAHEMLVGGAAPALLAVLALAACVLPAAIVRAAAVGAGRLAREAITVAAGIPLVAVACLTGATITVEDPAQTPAQLAHDLLDHLPPGGGVFVATRRTSWVAVQHEMAIAGSRPDLALAPPLPPHEADAIVANALRASRVAGADAAAFGRLDIRRAIPAGRGFQLVGEIPERTARVAPPARYATAVGREQAILLALERARHEAASGRLDAAARAAGQTERFGAADLAVLGSTVPSKDRPALFGFLPIRTGGAAEPRALAAEPVGPWLLDTFGDDLAWVAGIEVAEPPAHAPLARRLHARWRQILAGTLTPDAHEITELGPEAAAATRALFVPVPAERASGEAVDAPAEEARD